MRILKILFAGQLVLVISGIFMISCTEQEEIKPNTPSKQTEDQEPESDCFGHWNLEF